MQKSFLKLLAMAGLLSALNTAVAQDLGIDKVTYIRTVFSPGFFSSKWEDPADVTFVVEKNAVGQQVYREEAIHVFDPVSFGFTYAITKMDYEMKPVTNKLDEKLTVGETWKTSFLVPPRKGARCPSDVKFEFDSIVKEIKTVPALIDGKETSVQVAVVAQDGTWSAERCGSGKGTSSFVYAIDRKVFLSLESLAYLGDKLISGTKTSLKDMQTRKP